MTLLLSGAVVSTLLLSYLVVMCVQNKAQVIGLPHRWSITTGCLVQFQGRWFPLDQYLRLFGGGA